MKLLSSVCLLLISLNLYQINVEAVMSDIKQLFEVALKVYNSLPAVKEHLKDGYKTPQEEMLSGQRNIFNKLTQLSDDLASAKERILDKITRTLRNKLSEKIDKIFKYVEDINVSYKFLRSMKKKSYTTKRELLEFAIINTGFSLNELPAVLEKLHSALVNKDFNGDSVLSIMANSAYEFDTACIRGQSAQQLIYDIYKVVVDNDIKGLLVKLFSFDVLKKYKRDRGVNYVGKIEAEKQSHFERLNETYHIVREYMKDAPRIFWTCGPVENKLGVTYTKLDVFQGFFMNELDTTVYKIGFVDTEVTKYNLIMNQCDDYVDERYRCNSEICKGQPADRKCNHLRDCSYIDNSLQVCHSPKGSDRRYDWMKDLGNDVTYGDYYDSCKNKQEMNGWLAVSMCFCICENDLNKSLRYFSLLEAKSDIQRNKVVTGVRLQKVGYVIYLQIQQGVLAPGGQINGNIEWKPIQQISEKDLLSTKVSKYNYEDKGNGRYEEWTEFYKNDLVYTVTYKTNTILLDDIEGGSNEVVTGVRFQRMDDGLRLDIQLTSFSKATGRLQLNTNHWTYNKNPVSERREAKANVDDIPTKSKNLDTHSGKDEFVRFKMSDLRKDVSQNTIPFIDLQPVVPKAESPLPLSGVGIFYKHDEQHAGYVALRGIHYDLTDN